MTLLLAVACCLGVKAQVTSEPSPLQEDSQDVAIYFHADQGNGGLAGLSASTEVYAHTGVDLSSGLKWQFAPGWGDNSPKYKLEYVSENLWKLNIGDIRSYYGIEDNSVSVTRLCFVFRVADCSKQTEDIFLDVLDPGLQVSIESSISGSMVTDKTSAASFKVSATKTADIALYVNDEQIASATGQKSLETAYTFPATGNYTVKATAQADGETVEAVKEYRYVSDSKEAAYPGGTPVMGPVKNTDGSVTFCLGAPGKENVIIVGEWNGYEVDNDYVMNYTDVEGRRYFWTTVTGLDNDRMYGYYFLVDGELRVGDPYARLVLDPYNDKYLSADVFPGLPAYPEEKVQNVPLAIYQGNINDYDWNVENFKGAAPSDLIIYELLFRDFTGTEGKSEGNGTVRAAIEKLPYITALGVNAVELLPIMEFNGNNSWGYNPNFYFAPDKAYGTPDDYKEFIDECHRNGIAVILDMVFNQSDGLHPWYQMYQTGDNPFYNASAPHAYSVLNDWNQENPMVQEQWADVLRYWMTEYKIDGFRFDLVKGLGDNNSYADNSGPATDGYNASRVARMKKLQEVMLDVNPDSYFINENLAGAKEENEMAETGQLNWANINYNGCQFAMGVESGSDLNRFYAPKDGDRTWGSTVSYLESHDEQRLAYRQNQEGVTGVRGVIAASTDRLGSAAAQMLLSPGAHMIWQFSELGNYDNTKNTDGSNNTDPKPVRWNTLTGNARRMGLYNCYGELIAIRNGNKELFSKEAVFENNCGQGNWQNGRTLLSRLGDRELITVINPNVEGDITVTVDFSKSDDSEYRVLSKSYDSNPSFSASAKTVTVPANCYVAIGSLAVSAVEGIESDASALRAYAADGMIVVDYAPAGVEVYAIDGRCVGRVPGQGSVVVASGIYILRSGKETLKLLVK